MTEKLKVGDFVLIGGQDESKPLLHRVVSIDGISEAGGMTLVARWYRTETLRKVKQNEQD
jgi:hypothetical protein